jgi:hypothetical protein
MHAALYFICLPLYALCICLPLYICFVILEKINMRHCMFNYLAGKIRQIYIRASGLRHTCACNKLAT